MKDFNFIKKYVSRKKGMFILYIALCVFMGGTGILLPLVSGQFIDMLMKFQSSSVIKKFCAILFVFFLIKFLVGYIVQIIYIKLAVKLAYQFNFDIIKHVQKLPLNIIEKLDLTYINKTVNYDVNTIINYSLNVIQSSIMRGTALVFPILVLFYLNKTLFIFCIIFLIIYIISYLLIKKSMYNVNYQMIQAQYSGSVVKTKI